MPVVEREYSLRSSLASGGLFLGFYLPSKVFAFENLPLHSIYPDVCAVRDLLVMGIGRILFGLTLVKGHSEAEQKDRGCFGLSLLLTGSS